MMTWKEQLLEICYGEKQAPNAELDSVKKKEIVLKLELGMPTHQIPVYYSIGKKDGLLIYGLTSYTYFYLYNSVLHETFQRGRLKKLMDCKTLYF